jgi:hypothetical protein
LLNVDQLLGHLCFSRKSTRFDNFPDRATWLLLAPKARFGPLEGQFEGQLLQR